MSKTTIMIWFIFASLLLVLLPHTAWAFQQFEPSANWLTPWAAAIAFELAIAILTHKLSEKIASVRGRGKFRERYLNAYGVGLCIALAVSATANVMHASQFASEAYDSPFLVATFGGVLPLVSLLFARVLSQVSDDANDETDTAADLQKMTGQVSRLQAQADRMKTHVAELQTKAALWDKLNPTAQAAARYITGEFASQEQAATAAGVSVSTISRLAAQMNHGGEK
jgi:hypothetical protein